MIGDNLGDFGRGSVSGRLRREAIIMRLYRGLKKSYRRDLVPVGRLAGTDFTDCPATALRYAEGARGVLLVVEIPDKDSARPRVTQEFWLGMGGVKRYMAWGKFDAFLVAVLPAKELRARLRREGMRNAPDASKARLLEAVISVEIQRSRATRPAARLQSTP